VGRSPHPRGRGKKLTEDVEWRAVIGLALRLGVPPQVVLDMPESHFLDCLAFLSLESKSYPTHDR
jgi:hypothetical protein